MTNVEEALQGRVERLERQLVRWRNATAVFALLTLAFMLVQPAHAVERILNVMGLSADTVTAREIQTGSLRVSSSINAAELTVGKLTIRDSAGKVRAVLGVDDIGGSEVGLELRDASGGRKAILSVDDKDSRLNLWSGLNRPSANIWSSTETTLPAGVFFTDGNHSRLALHLSGKSADPSFTLSDANGKSRIELELSSEPARPKFTLSDAEGKSRIYMSANEGGFYAAFSSQFGSIEFDKNTKTWRTPEPMLKIRGAQGAGTELMFGVENGEPVAALKDGSGALVWEPKQVRPAETSKPKKAPKKEAVDPL